MSLIKQNTDYAFRLLVNLAQRWPEGRVSARNLAQEESVSYQFTCKILQKLHNCHLVESSMGPKGGYRLGHMPDQINMLEVIQSLQGPIGINKCMLGVDNCRRKPRCPISVKLDIMQQRMEEYFQHVTLAELADIRIDK